MRIPQLISHMALKYLASFSILYLSPFYLYTLDLDLFFYNFVTLIFSFLLNYFLLRYGVCKNRKYCKHMIETKVLSFRRMFMFCRAGAYFTTFRLEMALFALLYRHLQAKFSEEGWKLVYVTRRARTVNFALVRNRCFSPLVT